MASSEKGVLHFEGILAELRKMKVQLRPLKDMSHPVWSFYTRIDTDSEEEEKEGEDETNEERPVHDDDELHSDKSDQVEETDHEDVNQVEDKELREEPSTSSTEAEEPVKLPRLLIPKINTAPQSGVAEKWSTSEEEVSDDENDEVSTPKSHLPNRLPPYKRKLRRPLLAESESSSIVSSGRFTKFTETDIENLIAGMNKNYNTGSAKRTDWNKIKSRHNLKHISSNVVLKDKWRNLVKYGHVQQNQEGKWVYYKLDYKS